MPNQINFSVLPDDFFFVPGKNRGLAMIEECGPYWKEVEAKPMQFVVASGYSKMTETLTERLNRQNSLRAPYALEAQLAPVVIENAKFIKSLVTVDGKALLNGSAGSRARTQYFLKNKVQNAKIHEDIANFFTDERRGRSVVPIPLSSADTTGAPFAIDCRNLFNYFHFLTETLPQLTLIDEANLDRAIVIHSQTTSQKGFTKRFVQELFPHLSDRVTFLSDDIGVSYDRCISFLSMKHMFYQLSEKAVPNGGELLGKEPFSKYRQGRIADLVYMHLNMHEASLRKLREHAYSLLDGKDFLHLPRKFVIGRKIDHPRARVMEGAEKFENELLSNGFEKVYFEDLSPLEQVAIMRNCDTMVAAHGAGMANMLFASPDARVIEIGNLDSTGGRLNAFVQLADVSGCNYTNFFMDRVSDNPEDVKTGGLSSILVTDIGARKLLEAVLDS
jgi:hypothetical protein